MYLKDITLKDFRCFGGEQTVPLAPLTLLVGENSTGKTSFMSMVRALWELAFDGREPNFNRPPYQLGSFDEIVHEYHDLDERRRVFRAGCNVETDINGDYSALSYQINVEFKRESSMPALNKLRAFNETTWIECAQGTGKELNVLCGVNGNVWELGLPPRLLERSRNRRKVLSGFKNFGLFLNLANLANLDSWETKPSTEVFRVREGASTPSQEELDSLQQLSSSTIPLDPANLRAYATAPIRSAPNRTYELSPLVRDIEGKHVPMYLAHLNRHRKREWSVFKKSVERFGHASGLFDRINVRRLGVKGGDPFQIEIVWSQKGAETISRNLTDVGFGISQVMPVLTELLRRDVRHMLLFQQPEVHLHPSAQAALGSLFCEIAGRDRQIVVETHSDYILDRVRMDIRDQECKLQHQDVAILYFDRSGPSVKIHRINLDPAGNIVDPPPSYRQFFMHETNRLIGY